ncbi:MAG: peptidase M20, partial [Bacteroidota bacterium]
MDAALAYARDHADRFVEELKAWLRIPSISTDPAYAPRVREAADWLAQNLRDIGMQTVDVIDTDGHPVVLAEHHVAD